MSKPDPTDLARRMLASAKEASKGPWRVGTMTKDGVRVDTPETWFEMDTEKGEWGDNEEAVSAVCAALTGADET